MQRRTKLVLSTTLAAGGLLLVGLAGSALAQATDGSTPAPPGWMGRMMASGDGSGMHDQQMQPWHIQASGPGDMMGGDSTPAQMHAQLPPDVQQQMDSMHAQMPAELQQQMQEPGGCHDDTTGEEPAEAST